MPIRPAACTKNKKRSAALSSLNKRKTEYPPASLTLALCAAEGRLLMVLGRKGQSADGAEIIFAQDWQATAQGVELLAPALHDALAALGLTPRHIGRVAAVNGPGGFTGLRLTIATAAGLARALGAAQAPLPYLPLLAAQAAELWRGLNPDSAAPELWALTHARRALVYAQAFAFTPSGPAPRTEIIVLSLEESAALLAGREILAFGSGLCKNRDFFAAALPQARLLGPPFEQAAPSALLRAALAAVYSTEDITPLYVRQSDAEENLPDLAARLGLDPKDAAERLAALLAAPPQDL